MSAIIICVIRVASNVTLSGNEYRTPLHTIVEKTGRVRSKKRPKENCVMGHGTYNL